MDYHVFNRVYRDKPEFAVKAFTMATDQNLGTGVIWWSMRSAILIYFQRQVMLDPIRARTFTLTDLGKGVPTSDYSVRLGARVNLLFELRFVVNRVQGSQPDARHRLKTTYCGLINRYLMQLHYEIDIQV